MNFNNTDNLVTLFLCLFIVTYHSFTFLNLPINIINILRNPLVLLILLLISTFIVKNKIHILLSIILYFVVIVKSSENDHMYIEKEMEDIKKNDIEEEESIYEEDESIDEEDKDKNGIEDENVSKNEMNNTNQVKNKIEEENIYTLLNNDVKMVNDYEVVKDIKQNENIISNVTQTQLDKIQGDNFNHCK
tara:strand:+ start:181 stop:750 length:570 start_codon:yes stop_codon:yes gene_type:complete